MDNYFASNLKYLRKKKKLTQEELGKKLGKDYSTIGKWEKNINSPIMEDTFKIAEFFQVDITHILGRDLRVDEDSITQDEKLIDLMTKAEHNHNLKMVFEKTGDLDDKALAQLSKMIDIIKDEDS